MSSVDDVWLFVEEDLAGERSESASSFELPRGMILMQDKGESPLGLHAYIPGNSR